MSTPAHGLFDCHLDTNMQLLEFKCVEFAEELMYSHLSKDAETP